MWRIIALLVWIGIWTKLSIYKGASRPSQMSLLRFWMYIASIYDDLDSMSLE